LEDKRVLSQKVITISSDDKILEILNLKKYYLGSKHLESQDQYFKKFGVNKENEIS